jgi:hypothetical protein
MKCFKKWGFPHFQLRFPKKKTAHDFHGFLHAQSHSALKKAEPACLGKTGAVPGARAAKVLENMAIGLVSREILLENFVFAWFYHGFLPFKMIEHVGFLEKNAQKSLCPREHKSNR